MFRLLKTFKETIVLPNLFSLNLDLTWKIRQNNIDYLLYITSLYGITLLKWPFIPASLK